MLKSIELKNLIKASRQFVDDSISIMELNGEIKDCLVPAVLLGLDAKIQDPLREYQTKVDKAWDEWGAWSADGSAISVEELKRWIVDEFLDENDKTYQAFKNGQ